MENDQYDLDYPYIIWVMRLICSHSYHIPVPVWKCGAHESVGIGISCDSEFHFVRYYHVSQPKAITQTSKHPQLEPAALILEGFDVTGDSGSVNRSRNRVAHRLISFGYASDCHDVRGLFCGLGIGTLRTD